MEPYYYITMYWFGAKHYSENGEQITWSSLERYYDLHGYWYGA